MQQERGFHSGHAQPGKMVDSCLKDHLKLPAQDQGSYRDREGSAFLLFSYLLAFGMFGALFIHLSSFHHAQGPIHSSFSFPCVLGPYPFIFLAFNTLRPFPFILLAFHAFIVTTSPCAILANWGDFLVV